MFRKNPLFRTLCLVLCAVLLLSGCAAKQEDSQPYKDLAGVYLSDLSVEGGMSVRMFLQIAEDGSFVFSRENDFSSKEKGAGLLTKDAEGRDVFNYEIVRDDTVEKDSHMAAFEVTEEGGIRFTSLMWFGSATPRFSGEDGTETYPLFMPYEPDMDDKTTAPSETVKPTQTAPAETSMPGETTVPATTEQTQPEETRAPETEPAATEPAATEAEPTQPQATEPRPTEAKPTEPKQTEPQETQPAETQPPETEPAATEAPQPAFREGTYTGSLDKFVEAMQSDIHYDITLTLSGGAYTYQVDITLSGKMDHSETQTYSGDYTVDGLNLTMTGTLKSASVNADGSLTVTGIFSSFASARDTVTLY